MRITIDTELCTGHGRCYSLAPELFEPDDDGNGAVIGAGSVTPDLETAARRAADNCPERAVIVEA